MNGKRVSFGLLSSAHSCEPREKLAVVCTLLVILVQRQPPVESTVIVNDHGRSVAYGLHAP